MIQRTSIDNIICNCYNINRLYVNGYPEITDCCNMSNSDIIDMVSNFSIVTPIYINHREGINEIIAYLKNKNIPYIIEINCENDADFELLRDSEFSGVNFIFDFLETCHYSLIENLFEMEKSLISKLTELKNKKCFVSLTFKNIKTDKEESAAIKIISLYKNSISTIFIDSDSDNTLLLDKVLKSNKIEKHHYLLSDNVHITGEHIFDYKPVIINNFLTKNNKRLSKFINVLGVCNKCGNTPYITLIDRDQ